MPDVRPRRRYDYVTDPAEIYRRSFAEIRATADLTGLAEDARTVEFTKNVVADAATSRVTTSRARLTLGGGGWRLDPPVP